MLGQRLDINLKSQTLPRLDGQDEDGETLDSQFDLISIANSCPDLSILDSAAVHNGTDEMRVSPTTVQGGVDDVDGIFYKTVVIPNKLPLSFRRSTSLNSLGVDPGFGHRGTSSVVDGNTVSVLQPGTVAKVIGQLEKTLKKETNHHQHSSDFVRSALRASHNGTGSLHKSISSPSVPQCFGAVSSGLHDQRHKHLTHLNFKQPQPDVIQQHSSKRSFFRRKNKSKGGSLNSHPPVVVQYFRNNIAMDGIPGNGHPGEERIHELGEAALSDLSLGLQDADAECWALSMSADIVSRLDEKEVKRQEHMYELILTEKHHCLTLALMHYLFVGGMKKAGFGRQARLLFPDLKELLHVHFAFLRRMRERQLKFRDLGQPMDTLEDILVEQFTGDQWQILIRLYGLLCASHSKSLDMFKSLLKDQKFASLVSKWDKEPLLSRKNVRECLLLVAQRITKYPLLFEPLLKTGNSPYEKEQISKALTSSKELIAKVNERVAERQRMLEICQKIDSKSYVTVGQKRKGKDDIISVPSRRLLFHGQALVNCNRGSSSNLNGAPGSTRNVPCTVLILTDSLVFTQEFSGRLHFVSPPGVVMLNNLIVREKAGQNTSLFLVLGTGTAKPEMIELQVLNPPNREIWMEKMRDAISKCEEEGEAGSDVDEDLTADSIDYSDVKTTRALEELQEQDRQLLGLLKSRSKLIDTLRTDKPHHWSVNHFEGKDCVLNAVSIAANEVQRMIHHLDETAASGVNRSASCAGEHMGSGGLMGLPRRADTFGGFDSQQRSAMDLPQNMNSKALFQLVIQLADLCGEMFQQMVPQLTPNVYQNHHQLQRRMEDLREAQQRLETEKALWQQELSSQKEDFEKQKSDLTTWKESLHKEQADISQQREQLYRKLEAWQRQGQGQKTLFPTMNPVSPVTVNAVVEKNTTIVPARRPPVIAQPPVVAPPVVSNGPKQKQQLPLHLAASSSFKGSLNSPPGASEAPKPVPRSISVKGNSSGIVASQSQIQQPGESLPATRVNQGNIGSSMGGSRRGPGPPAVQQLLPLRLSEGTMKTSSLPRGVGSRSVSNMMSQSDQQPVHQSNSQLRSSGSSSHFLLHSNSSASIGDSASPSNSSYLYGPSTNDRMSSYYKNPHADPRNNASHSNNGYIEYPFNSNSNSGVAIVHRRSGSSPVPMSGSLQNQQNQNSHLNTRDDDHESTKILFL